MSSHTSCVLKWSGTLPRFDGPASSDFSHIYWNLKRSRIWWNAFGIICIISLHISMVLKWPGTNNSMHSLLCSASLHVSWVLKWSGTYTNETGSMCTASLHIPWVLRWSGTTIIQLVMFIYTLRPGQGPKYTLRWWFQQLSDNFAKHIPSRFFK